jgi:hypothetical protein
MRILCSVSFVMDIDNEHQLPEAVAILEESMAGQMRKSFEEAGLEPNYLDGFAEYYGLAVTPMRKELFA